jgi:hypothetical protein
MVNRQTWGSNWGGGGWPLMLQAEMFAQVVQSVGPYECRCVLRIECPRLNRSSHIPYGSQASKRYGNSPVSSNRYRSLHQNGRAL